MNIQSTLANQLMTRLLDVPGFSKIGGLVQTLETTERIESGALIRYPVTQDILAPGRVPVALGPIQYADMVPDSRETGLLYAEDLGLTIRDIDRQNLTMTSKIRVVAVLNLDPALTPDPISPNAVIAAQVAVLQKLLLAPGQPYNQLPFTKMKHSGGQILGIEDRLFSRYTYRPTTRPFTLAPFHCFGLDVITDFTVPTACLTL